MTGTFRIAAVTFAVLTGTVLAGCGGGGEAGSPEGSPTVRSSEEDLDGPMVVEGPPDVSGTWVGETTGYDGDYATTLFLEQDGERLSGYRHAASVGGGEPVHVGLSGEAKPGVFSVTESPNGGPGGIAFDAEVTGDVMEYWLQGWDKVTAARLTKVPTARPERMGQAAVQAVYSRDWAWLSEHGSNDLEDGLETDHEDEVEPDETYDEFAQMVAREYEAQMAFADEDDEPAVGASVTLDEGSVVLNEVDSSTVTAEFDYTTSDGMGGDAFVALVRAGTANSGFAYQVDNLSLDYESEGGDYEMTIQ